MFVHDSATPVPAHDHPGPDAPVGMIPASDSSASKVMVDGAEAVSVPTLRTVIVAVLVPPATSSVSELVGCRSGMPATRTSGLVTLLKMSPSSLALSTSTSRYICG